MGTNWPMFHLNTKNRWSMSNIGRADNAGSYRTRREIIARLPGLRMENGWRWRFPYPATRKSISSMRMEAVCGVCRITVTSIPSPNFLRMGNGLLHQRPRRNAANLPDVEPGGSARGRRAARHLEWRLQYNAADQSGWPFTRLYFTRRRGIQAAHSGFAKRRDSGPDADSTR